MYVCMYISTISHPPIASTLMMSMSMSFFDFCTRSGIKAFIYIRYTHFSSMVMASTYWMYVYMYICMDEKKGQMMDAWMDEYEGLNVWMMIWHTLVQETSIHRNAWIVYTWYLCRLSEDGFIDHSYLVTRGGGWCDIMSHPDLIPEHHSNYISSYQHTR